MTIWFEHHKRKLKNDKGGTRTEMRELRNAVKKVTDHEAARKDLTIADLIEHITLKYEKESLIL